MGWSGGNEVFDAMAKQMQTAPRNVQVHTMTALIKTLERQDWDTADECLEDWKHVPAYVEAFKVCGYEIEEEERVVEVTLYAHDDNEEGYHDEFRKAGIGWASDDRRYYIKPLYEIAVNCELEAKSGRIRIVGVDGHKLSEPLPWQ